MQSPDARYVIVFNGEIYNFPELRVGLEAAEQPQEVRRMLGVVAKARFELRARGIALAARERRRPERADIRWHAGARAGRQG